MATVINLNEKQNPTSDLEMPEKLKTLFEERKKAKREPLTPETLRKGKGLENLTDEEALKAIDSIKKLSAILFEMACHNETTCIDNQQVVHLKQQNKAA
jgi:hypothetical protein